MLKYQKVLFVLIITILITSIKVSASGVKGDVTGDGAVTVFDYIAIRKHIIGIKKLTSEELKRADISGANDKADGKISSLDYIAIRKIIINNSNNKYTVTFDSSGGSKVTTQIVSKNLKAKEPSKPIKDGYTFLEWQLNGKKYSFNSSVISNIKLVAIWAKNNETYYLKTNETKKLDIIYPNTGNISLKYTDPDEDVAKVNKSNGDVYAVGAGNTSFMVQYNNQVVSTIEIVVDYSFFDTCDKDKNAILSSVTTKNKTINIYSCLENQKFYHQGLAVSIDSIYYAGYGYLGRCYNNREHDSSKYAISKYNLGKITCNLDDKNILGVSLLLSGNFIKKYDKNTGKYITNYLDLGGHGQSFDVTKYNKLFLNFFPYVYYYESDGHYGPKSTGIAYVKKLTKNNEYIYPDETILVKKEGVLEFPTLTYKKGTVDYFKYLINRSKESDNIGSLLIAVDEIHNQIGILGKTKSEFGNLPFFIYKLDDFVDGKKTLIGQYFIPENACGGKICGHQGIDLYGNYLYSAQDNGSTGKNEKSVSKINYKTCPIVDKKSSCNDVESLNIEADKIGMEYEKNKLVGLSEIEGISIAYNGKAYVSVITKPFSDNSKRNITLLLDGFANKDD